MSLAIFAEQGRTCEGDNNEGEITREFAGDFAGIENHREALTGTLGMPEYA